MPVCLSALFLQERDAERRRQLRERARQLIAEARSGVKMSEMSLSDSSSPDRGRGGKTSLAGGESSSQHTHTHACTHTSYSEAQFTQKASAALRVSVQVRTRRAEGDFQKCPRSMKPLRFGKICSSSIFHALCVTSASTAAGLIVQTGSR